MANIFVPQMTLFGRLVGAINNTLNDIEVAIQKANKTNEIWGANFRIMNNGFDQLKKKV